MMDRALCPGSIVEIDVPGAGDGARFVGKLEGVSETHAAVRLANRMLVSVEHGLVHPSENGLTVALQEARS